MAKKIVDIDSLCAVCGYFANCEHDTHDGHSHGCDHPKREELQCMACSCPLGYLAEKQDFIEIDGDTEEDAEDNDNESNCVVIDDTCELFDKF